MKKRPFFIRTAIFAIFLYMASPVYAQGFDDIDFEDDTQDVPFDGGISLLVATGVAYGIRRVYHVNAEKKNADMTL